MQAVLTRAFQGLAWLVLAGLVVEFYLAGAAVFGVTSFQPHRALGVALAVAILLLLVLALVARSGRRVVRLVALLAALTAVQVLLPSLATRLHPPLPWAAALHVVNTAVLLAVAGANVRVPGRAASGEPKSRGPGGGRSQHLGVSSEYVWTDNAFRIVAQQL